MKKLNSRTDTDIGENKVGRKAYDNFFKYKMIEELCNGKSAADIEREYGVKASTAVNWLRDFIENGAFDDNALSKKENLRLEQLKEKARKRELEIRFHGTTTSDSLEWILEYDSDLQQWKEYATEWIKTIVRSKATALKALSNFFKKYVVPYNITRSVQEFISREYDTPDFYEIIYVEKGSQSYALDEAKKIVAFIDWVIEEKFSVEDDLGNKLTPAEFENPLTKYLPDSVKSSQRNESDKNVLPYRYIKDLRNLLSPPNATYFKDLKFAQGASDSNRAGGDWFIVDKSIIDKNDPDCVYRFRKASKYEQTSKGLSDEVYEMWFPGTTVALLTKLLLPLRTYQVRMLDSGEMTRLIADDGGLSEQALRNKNAEDYRVLISQWAEYYKATTKKPKKEKTSTVNDDILASISEPTTKALVGMLMSENKKLKRENSLLKEQTTLTIDMRPINDISRNKDVVIIEPSYNLTDTEIDALRNAISNEFMNHQGWTTDNYGRVKENGIQVYKAGYVTAIQKILNKI